jgi:FMN phosphatase YigB (HAD superfamily)
LWFHSVVPLLLVSTGAAEVGPFLRWRTDLRRTLLCITARLGAERVTRTALWWHAVATERSRGRVVLLDVDNTLLDNDAAKAALASAILAAGGDLVARRFWELYEKVRTERGVVDYPETLARVHRAIPDAPAGLDDVVWGLAYEEFLYPNALEVVSRLWTMCTPVVLTDGDALYQPMKIARSGITGAVRGNVLVFDHKDEHRAEVSARYPADGYVLVDDRAEILSRVKRQWGQRVLTVHVRQGHYGADPAPTAPDLSIRSIGELMGAISP